MRKSDGLGRDPHRDKPRKATRSGVADRLNNLAMSLSGAFEQLSELRRELNMPRAHAEPDDSGPSLPMRYMEPGEREP